MQAKNLRKQPSVQKGWEGYRDLVMHPSSPDIQKRECRLAFFAGAAILYESIMERLPPGKDDVTEDDLRLMMSIAKELEEFTKTFDQ